jgi:hypothetical protein
MVVILLHIYPYFFILNPNRSLCMGSGITLTSFNLFQPSLRIQTAGEATDQPAFLNVIQDIAKEIPRVRAECGATKKLAEVVVPDEPAFAATRGAAIRLQTRVDRSY